MSGAALQELEVVGDELHNPMVVSTEDLEKASQVLSDLSSAIEQWKKGIAQNDHPQKLAELIAEATRLHAPVDKGQIGPASQVLRQIGEKALALVQGLQTDPATVDLTNELAAIIGLLNQLANKYPKPDSRVSSKYPTLKGDFGSQMIGVAEMALQSSQKIISEKAVTRDIHAEIETLVYELGGLSAQYSVAKNESKPNLPPISEEGEEGFAHAMAMNQVLKEVTDRATTLAKMADSKNPSDAVKTEIGALHDLVKAAKERCPMQTAKAAGGAFSKTLREVSERALSLSSKAKAPGFEAGKGMREIRSLVTLLQGLTEKYPNVKKADEVEMSDFGLLLDASRRLDDIEDEIAKAGKTPEELEEEQENEKKRKAAEEEKAKKAKVEEDEAAAKAKKKLEEEQAAKAAGGNNMECKACKAKLQPDSKFCAYCGKPVETVAGGGPPPPEMKPEEKGGAPGGAASGSSIPGGSTTVVAPEQTTKPTSPTQTAPNPLKKEDLDAVAKRLEDALKEVGELQAVIAKARQDVVPPASTGTEPDPDTDALLFPQNYNDPAYREALAKRESA
jgi:hypothetical protein